MREHYAFNALVFSQAVMLKLFGHLMVGLWMLQLSF